MDNSTQVTQRAVAGQAATDPATPSPTVTHYQQLADDFLKTMDTLAASLPIFQASHETTVKFVRGKLNVPLSFMASAVAAVEQDPSLQGIRKLDTQEARDTLQFLEAFRTVVDKVTAFGKALDFTMNARRANLAADSLQIYGIAKEATRDPASALITGPHVQSMSRDLGRRGIGRKKKTPTTPATVPPATPTPTPAPHQPAAPVTPAPVTPVPVTTAAL
jgi:hypothetical protein